MEPQLSIVCLNNGKIPAPDQCEPSKNLDDISPMSNNGRKSSYTLTTPYTNEKNLDQVSASTVTSPVEQSVYFPFEKIPYIESAEKQWVEEPPPPVIIQPAPPDSENVNSIIEKKSVLVRKPFWERHLYLILGIIALFAIFFSIIGVLISRLRPHKENIIDITQNFTRNSVACTGLTLNDSKTWNMQVFSQNSSGNIVLQVSLDGEKFEPATNISLDILPRKKSPISATAAQDNLTGSVMLNLFYVSGNNNITMSTIICANGSAKCDSIDNQLIPTEIPVSRDTGLAAVNVNNTQDWRVFYYDQFGFISQLQGNTSGFNLGTRIGGEGLNGSDITAVNVNSTNNNIHVFYTDMLTQALFTLQFQSNWSTPRPVSNTRVNNWNPHSGLGSAYRPSLDQLHVYYTGLDKGVYEFVLNGTSGSDGWAGSNSSFYPQPDGSRPWAEADYEGADISAIGWKDQVRFFQPARGRMVMGELNNMTWGEIFVDMITSGSKILA
ncbi:hypothetical protein HI914_06649 [Erysiphe necator]|nr:hypothetical protein HI914_06649 [Erysiphe necator]